METFPWEVGDPPDGCGSVAEEALVLLSSSVRSTLTVAGRSVMQMISVSWSGGGDVGILVSSSSHPPCKWIGGGYGWKRESVMEPGDAHGVSTPPVEVGSRLNLGLTDITKYSSYSKLWRMLYFRNDAPFCIHAHGCTTAPGEAVGMALPHCTKL